MRVNQHAVALHREKNLRNRHLDLLVDKAQFVVVLHKRRHGLVQLQGNIRVLRGVFGSLLNRYLIKPYLFSALASDFFKRNRLDAKMALAQVIHAVIHVRFEHIRLQQRVMHHAT